MILLWGHAGDSALVAVYRSLCRFGVEIAFYDQRAVLDTEIELAVGAEVGGVLRVGGVPIDLGRVEAAYIRPFDSRWLPQIAQAGHGSPEWLHGVKVEDALLSWAEIAPGLVVNRPSAISLNTSKPFQAALLRAQGFDIPETLVTTDPQAAREFREKHGEVIYKSISSQRSIVSRLGAEQLSHLDDISWCPTQFQQYIPGNDYRVHVVGDEVFACEIVSDADDYRFASGADERVELRAFELAEEMAGKCRRLAGALGLAVAGIDLRRTPDGSWFCFEANPVAGFTYYQAASNHRIDDAIARLLVNGAMVQ